MPSFGQNLQGRTVYGSGSYAPTKGQVSAQGAQGYLRRELRNRGNQGTYGGVSRFGRDGQSDTRSGIAQRALQGGNRWAGQEGMGGLNNGGKTPYKPGGRPNVQAGVQGGGNTVRQPGASPAPAVPTVVVNDSGQLELPYSADYSADVLEGLTDSNAALLELQKMQQQQAIKYQQDKRNAEQGYEVTKRDTLNDNAARGVAFSSGYGVAVGKNANDYNTLQNSLDLANSQANSQFDFDRTAIMNAFKDQLRRGGLDYADSLTEDAGTYGYGNTVRRPKVKRRPRPNGGGSGDSGGGSGGGGHKGQPKKPTGGGRGKK